MTTTYSALTGKKKEYFDFLWDALPAYSGYWLESAECVPHPCYPDEDEVLRLVIQDGIVPDGAMPSHYIITKDEVLARLAGDVGQYFANHPRDYFKSFGRDVLQGDFERMDYDADVTDVALQRLMFSKVLFG